MDHKKYKYHHIGLPTTVPQQNEEYNPAMKHYAAGYFESQYGIEWLRFEAGSPLHPLIQTVPHIAFVVEDIKAVILGKKVIFGPDHHPAHGVTVCFIEEDGAPVEFLQFDRAEHEIWPNATKIINPVTPNKNQKPPYNMEYHHFGICTQSKKKEETFLENYRFYCTDHEANPFALQWMRYETDCQLPDMVKNITHVAFKVDNLEAAIRGKKVIIKPNSPSAGVLVAFIEENGAPIEFLQFDKN